MVGPVGLQDELDRGLADVELDSLADVLDIHDVGAVLGDETQESGQRSGAVGDHRPQHDAPSRRGLAQTDALGEPRGVDVSAGEHDADVTLGGALDLARQECRDADRAGALDDQLRALEQEHHCLRNLVVALPWSPRPGGGSTRGQGRLARVAEAMVLLLERSKLVVEGAGAVGVAGQAGGQGQAPRRGSHLRRALRRKRRRLAARRVHPSGRDRGGTAHRAVDGGPRPPPERWPLSCVSSPSTAPTSWMSSSFREGVELHVRETAIELVLQTDGPDHSKRILDAVRAEGGSDSPGALRAAGSHGPARPAR